MDDFDSFLKRRMEWDTAVEEGEKAVKYKLDSMNSGASHASAEARKQFAWIDDDRERLAQAWARILQG